VNASQTESALSARTAILLATVALLVVAGLALMLGAYGLSPSQTLSALMGSGDSQASTVVWQIRVPRIGAAILAGAALSAAGASFQTLFRNPLVSPDILGVAAGAGFGAIVGILLNAGPFLIQAFAFASGLAVVSLVMLIASSTRQTDRILSLVLTGVVVGALAGAMTSLLKVTADPFDQLPAMTFWLLGSLSNISMSRLLPALGLVIVGLIPLVLLRWRMNVLTLGDDEARSLGVNVRQTRFVVIAAATLVTAGVTAMAGLIGWVGLVIPHIARMIVGPSFAKVLPVSILIGAGYLLTVDTVARNVSDVEIPLGILTALIGAPFFVWLLARGRRGWS
jgi:iron complex transport system permease protein